MSGKLDTYDSGLLNDWGGGNVGWWQDYIRAELGRAHEFYAAQIEAAEAREAKLAEALRERAEAACEADCDSLSPLGPLHSVNCRAAYALLALYDAPAVQMPGDRHPQGE